MSEPEEELYIYVPYTPISTRTLKARIVRREELKPHPMLEVDMTESCFPSDPPAGDTIDTSVGSQKAVYRCGVRDALRAVLRELEKLGGNDPFRQSLALLDIRDRIRAALGEET